MRRELLTEAKIRAARKPVELYDTESPHLALRVLPSGRKSFVAVVNGRRLSLGEAAMATKEDIDKARAEARRYHQAGGKPRASGSLGGLIDARFADGRNEHGAPLAANSLEAWHRYAEALGPLRDKPADRVSIDEIIAHLEITYRKPGHHVAANRAWQFLAHVYRWARNQRIFKGVSPFDGVTGKGILTKERSEDRVYTPDELKAIFQAAKGEVLDFLLLCLTTAAREEQVRAMRWQDLRGTTWHVPESLTKEAAYRLPLSTLAVEVLERRGRRDIGFVFPGEDVGRFWSRPQRQLTRIGVDAKLGENLKPHNLRRTAADGMLQAGAPLHVVNATLGHALTPIERTYCPTGVPLDAMSTALEGWAGVVRAVLEEKAQEAAK